MACWLCEENDRQAAGTCDGAVAELETGWVRLHRIQRYRGAAFFAAKACVREVYDLERPLRDRHLVELAEVASVLDEVFAPRKMNLESLGNGVPHLHWWLTPRYDGEPRPASPIWEDLDFLRDLWSDSGRCDPDVLAADAAAVASALGARGLVVRR